MRRHLLLVPATALALALSACSGGDTPADDGAATGGSVTFEGTDSIAWSSSSLSTSAGPVDITLVCGENANHSLAIEGVQGDAELAACDAGATATATATLEAGTYTFFCTVQGHREAGMEGTLTVS